MARILGVVASSTSKSQAKIIGYNNLVNADYSATSIAVSSDKKTFYQSGGDGTNSYIMAIKNTDGSIVWQKSINYGAYSNIITTLPDGSLHMFPNDPAKYGVSINFNAADGSINTQYRYGGSMGWYGIPKKSDGNNEWYFPGYNGSVNGILARLNSSFVLQNAYRVINDQYSTSCASSAVNDANDRVIFGGYCRGGYKGWLMSSNRGLTSQYFSKQIYDNEGNVLPFYADDDGNFYATYRLRPGSYYTGNLTKFDGSCNAIWTATLDTGSYNDWNYATYNTEDNCIYVVGWNYYAKYNNSGTLQYQRRVTSNTGSFHFTGGTLAGSYLYMAGVGPGDYGFSLVLPTDGSGTGSYSVGSYTITIAAGTGTVGNTAPTIYASPLGSGTIDSSNFNRQVTDYTNSNASYTYTKTLI